MRVQGAPSAEPDGSVHDMLRCVIPPAPSFLMKPRKPDETSVSLPSAIALFGPEHSSRFASNPMLL